MLSEKRLGLSGCSVRADNSDGSCVMAGKKRFIVASVSLMEPRCEEQSCEITSERSPAGGKSVFGLDAKGQIDGLSCCIPVGTGLGSSVEVKAC